MSIDGDPDPEQQDLDGMRPKPIAAIERQARKVVASKAAVKVAKEKFDTDVLGLARVMKEAKRKVYVSAAFNIHLDEIEKVIVKDLGGKSPGSKDDDDL